MRYEDASPPECDTTLEALATVIDGSLSGLARYHLLRQELDAIRVPARASRPRPRPGAARVPALTARRQTSWGMG